MTMFDCSKGDGETYSKEFNKKSTLEVSKVDDKVVSIHIKNTNFRFKLLLISVVLIIICGAVVYINL